MSVLAWDGKTLAADRRVCIGNQICTYRKIFRHEKYIFGYAGESYQGEELMEWFRAGCLPDKFPECLRDKENYTVLLVIGQDKKVKCYNRSPYPDLFSDEIFAVGSGRDYALAAMHLGKTAKEAVEVACHFDSSCGNGVDVLSP